MPIYLVPYAAKAEEKEKAMKRTENEMAGLCMGSFRQTGQEDKHVSEFVCM